MTNLNRIFRRVMRDEITMSKGAELAGVSLFDFREPCYAYMQGWDDAARFERDRCVEAVVNTVGTAMKELFGNHLPADEKSFIDPFMVVYSNAVRRAIEEPRHKNIGSSFDSFLEGEGLISPDEG